MALWGNSDNVGSIGTVTLDYSNRVVSGWAGTATGLGVSFGESGYAQVGDTISFGQHGTGTYFGEAIIASIGSTLQVTIASTVALNAWFLLNSIVVDVKLAGGATTKLIFACDALKDLGV